MAQIHQLRGRVGRGKEDGVCILLYKNTLKEYSYQRLLAIKETDDGFDIAEKDLALRGGGEVLGIKQYGYQNFVFFDIYKHKVLINIAIIEANNILKNDPSLSSNRGKKLVNLLYLFGKSEAVDLISAG
jgi:ATP-dependent DNA helicase RecG